jgi:lipopolysaccharide transport system ATP-binding protein
MGAVAKQGRTVLFVSHNMSAIKSLCSRAILLEGGRVATEGNVDEVVNSYLLPETDMVQTGIIPDDVERITTGEAKLRSVELANTSGRSVSQLYYRQPFRVTVMFDVLRDIQDVFIEVNLGTPDGVDVVFATTLAAGKPAMDLMTGRYEVHADFDIVLLPGRYSIGVGIHHPDGMTVDFVRRVFDFLVLKVAQNGNDHFPWSTVRGYVGGLARWQIRQTIPDTAEKIHSMRQ